MDKNSKRRTRETREAITRQFAEGGFSKKRSPREEVIEILSEGLWTLICQGRGPASGHFESRGQSVPRLRDHGLDDPSQDCSSI